MRHGHEREKTGFILTLTTRVNEALRDVNWHPRAGVGHASMSEEMGSCWLAAFVVFLFATALCTIASTAYAVITGAGMQDTMAVMMFSLWARFFLTLLATVIASCAMSLVIGFEKALHIDLGAGAWSAIGLTIAGFLGYLPILSTWMAALFGLTGLMAGFYAHRGRARHLNADQSRREEGHPIPSGINRTVRIRQE